MAMHVLQRRPIRSSQRGFFVFFNALRFTLGERFSVPVGFAGCECLCRVSQCA